MGNQVSNTNTAAGKFAFESKKGAKIEKAKIGILSFEVASVMSKAVQLWQSLSEEEILCLRTEVIKSEGVLKVVSDNESVLLSLACMEKLQDLTTVALAVARLGKRCHEPALQGFEHVYNDVLKQNIDIRELEFPRKEMEAKVKKMEKYMGTTSNLYQELEILSEMEQALRRVHDEDDASQKDNHYALERKAARQRQEIKYLKDISLWNRTYDKIVGLLARTVCTNFGRIIDGFGFPLTGWPQLISLSKNGKVPQPFLYAIPQTGDSRMLRSGSQTSHTKRMHAPSLSADKFYNGEFVHANGMRPSSATPTFSAASMDGVPAMSQNVIPVTYRSLSLCFSPARQSSELKNTSDSHHSMIEKAVTSSVVSQIDAAGSCMVYSKRDQVTLPLARDRSINSFPLSTSGPLPSSGANENGEAVKLLFDPKIRLQNAPSYTLGGAALALHYANVIIIVERMTRYPHLISQDARDDLYQMLPKNVRMALRAKLMRGFQSPNFDGDFATDWKKAVERILGWVAPLAHNMIRWQSEHNFEQQQMVARSNVLLLQTLYFADQLKVETAMTDLLVGLNYLWRQEREIQANALMEYAENKDLDEYLEWQV